LNAAFADTSGLLAFLVESDREPRIARAAFALARSQSRLLLTTSYVLSETYALLGRRAGWDAVSGFREGFAPLLVVAWVDAALHEAGLDLLLARRRRRLSLVDAVSFVAMRQRGLTQFFGFDADFEAEGFEPLV
jgi:predicted nucleic acid-binding protein